MKTYFYTTSELKYRYKHCIHAYIHTCVSVCVFTNSTHSITYINT